MSANDGSIGNNKDLVAEAYKSYFQLVWSAYTSAYTSAKGDPQAEARADEAFKTGVRHARHLRDRALALLDVLG